MKNICRKIMHGLIAVMRVLIPVICVVIIAFAFSNILKYVGEQMQQERLIQEIRLKKQEAVEEDNPPTEDIADCNEEKQMLQEYVNLYKENEDLYGWITIEDTDDTKVDYPVMFTPDSPSFYIHKNWERKESSLGSLWIDERTSDNSANVIIYGHNMKSGEMFGSLDKYKNESFYKEHMYIKFDTLYERETYEIISVVKTEDDETDTSRYQFYDHIELDSEEEFQEYIEQAKKNACYQIETTAEFGDHLITLSTCDYWSENARLLIIAKKIS